MADTPKTPEPSGGRGPTSPSNRSRSAGAQRRFKSRHHDEERNQFLIVAVTVGAIGLALLSVLIGIGYDQLWLPSRPVAQVGEASLSRRDYWEERKQAYLREIVQNFQLLALFGGNQQFSQQFAGQSPNIQLQIAGIRNAEVDDAVVGEWQTRKVKEQGAATLSISASQDEINQAMAQDLGQIFLPPPPQPTPDPSLPTATPAPTATLEPTATITPTPGGPTATAAPTSTPEPTATPGPTDTPAPTSTLVPTPQPAEAVTQVDQIINEIFRRYEIEMAAAGQEPSLTKEEFRAALNEQYREQVLSRKIQESLVPEAAFTASTEPTRVSARQILIAVTTDAQATQEQIDAAFAAARPEADAILAELRGGADFAALAAERSADPGSKDSGGDLGSFDTAGAAENGATYPPELVAQAFALEQDALSEPIRTQFGWHIIQVTNRDVPTVEAQLREARTTALDKWVEEQRAAIGVQRFPEPTATATVLPTTEAPTAVPTYLPGPPTPEPTATPEPTPEPVPTVDPSQPTATTTP